MGMSPSGNLSMTSLMLSFSRPAMAKLCPSAKLHDGLCSSPLSPGITNPENGHSRGEIEFRDLRGDLDINFAVAQDRRRKGETDPEGLVFDRHAAQSLWHGYREFPAGKEIGVLTTEGDEGRLRQDLHQAVLFQGVDEPRPRSAAGPEPQEGVHRR